MQALTAINKSSPVAYVSLLRGAVLSGLLVLLVVHFRLGLAGAAYAGVISSCAAPLMLGTYAYFDQQCRGCWPGWTRAVWSGWGEYLRLGLPACLMSECPALIAVITLTTLLAFPATPKRMPYPKGTPHPIRCAI